VAISRLSVIQQLEIRDGAASAKPLVQGQSQCLVVMQRDDHMSGGRPAIIRVGIKRL
jgi:hypothetical protein